MTKWLSLSTGASGAVWGNIRGVDALLDPADEPTKDTNVQGGKRVDAFWGGTLTPSTGFLHGQQFLVQVDVPIAQSLDGPQLKRSYMLHVAWQWGF